MSTFNCCSSQKLEQEEEEKEEEEEEEEEGEDEPDMPPSLEGVLAQLGLSDLLATFTREQVDFDSLVRTYACV